VKSPKNPKKPHVSRELLVWLQDIFPDKAPNREDSDREVWIKRGHVEVVRKLTALHDQQET
jgi:hypothetical protein